MTVSISGCFSVLRGKTVKNATEGNHTNIAEQRQMPAQKIETEHDGNMHNLCNLSKVNHAEEEAWVFFITSGIFR